jgi:enoyl-CoA hydratase
MTGPGPTETVLHEVVGPIGRLTLNRPGAINALDDAMVVAALHRLQAWAVTPDVRAVWVEGAGDKGLCAGGDVRALRSAIRDGEVGRAMEFWAHEYALNGLIARYPKPYVAWMDGIVMGGGVGISAHGSHRLVTERTRLAMPETIIGFFPDVGGLWFLARSPGELGTHVALTGLPVNGADAVLLGLADVLVPSRAKESIEADLARTMSAAGTDDTGSDDTGADGHHAGAPTDDTRGRLGWSVPSLPDPGLPTPTLAEHRDWIDECYAGDDAAEILSRLARHSHPAARRAAEAIEERSPHSVVMTLEALRRAGSMSVQEVLEQDRRLGRAFVQHPDFDEGVRALLVDKDNAPRWSTAHVDDVSRGQVLAAFDTAH